jgi:hypothetical protein
LSDAEIRQLATKIVEPEWPVNSVEPGQVVEAEVSVNEQGKLTGLAFSKTKASISAIGAVNDAVSQWNFRPLIRNGKLEYFHGVVKFIVR